MTNQPKYKCKSFFKAGVCSSDNTEGEKRKLCFTKKIKKKNDMVLKMFISFIIFNMNLL